MAGNLLKKCKRKLPFASAKMKKKIAVRFSERIEEIKINKALAA